jgi:hypothetical protein
LPAAGKTTPELELNGARLTVAESVEAVIALLLKTGLVSKTRGV